MNQSVCIRRCLTPAFLFVAFASTADAQSLTRLQGLGGRQLDGPNANVERFLSGDRWALCTISDGIVPGDTNGWNDAALFDLWTGDYTFLITGAGGAQLDGESVPDAASANGNFVNVHTDATNLGFVDTNGVTDVYMLDRTSRVLQRVSLGQGGVEPDLWSYGGEISNDGRWAVFSSEATNVVSGDNNGANDVFVRDMSTGTVELISMSLSGGFGNNWSWGGDISADGRFVLFTSFADDLVAGDTAGWEDLFLRDRLNGTTERLNLGPGGIEANGDIYWKSGMSADARWVFFGSWATNLHPNTNGTIAMFVLDRQSGVLSLESIGPGGAPGNGDSFGSGMSEDGRTLTFMSYASNLDPIDNDLQLDEFRRDIATGTTRMISQSTGGDQGQLPGAAWHMGGTLSPSGRLASFRTNLFDLVAGDTNNGDDTFVYDAASVCAPIESYCVAKANSLGCTPAITSGGEPYTSGAWDAFFISAHSVRNNAPGIFLWSLSDGALPFYGGTLCLTPPLWRTPGQDSAGSISGNDCSGSYSFHFTQAYMTFRGIGPGTLVHGQFWSRDSGLPPPNNVGLTDGLRFVTGP